MPRAEAPQVLDGMRAPRAVRLDDMKAAAEKPFVPQPVAGGDGTVYVSNIRRYRVQVTAPRNFTDPTTGRKFAGGELYAAVFEDGVYRNNHRDPKMRALIDETLQSNPYFGPFGSHAHFWLASDQKERMEKAKVDAALNTLKSLPKEAVETFVASLHAGTEEDHSLPPAESRGGVRPIAPRP